MSNDRSLQMVEPPEGKQVMGSSLVPPNDLEKAVLKELDIDKLNDLAISVSFPTEIAGWTLAPSLNYVTLVSDSIRASDSFSSESDYFFVGISLSKSF